jgi:hypothetical protein
MDLFKNSADTGPTPPHHNKEILYDEPFCSEFIDNFYMSQSLSVCANLVLAFYDVQPFDAENSPSFAGRQEVQIQDGFMILFRRVISAVV